MSRPRSSHTTPLVATAAAAAVGFTLLARSVARRETAHVDARVRRRFPRRRRRITKRAATALGPVGKPWVHGPIAGLLAWGLWRHGRASAAGAVALSSGVAIAMTKGFERALKRRRPPPGRHKPSEPSFPSGHSLQTTAVALTSAYVLSREGIADPRVAAPLALALPVTTGIDRLYLDRHWATDVAGGWLAGLFVAAGCAALYEARA